MANFDKGLPTNTQKLFVISRVKDTETRDMLELDDGWQKSLTFAAPNEKKAVAELKWLLDHSKMREYMLIARIDTLNEEIRF